MKKNRAISLLLAMVMILALSPAALAVYSYHMDVTVEEPVAGAKPAATAVSRNNKDTDNPKAIPVSETPQVKWSGELDANGCFKAGVAYTVTVTERMGDARWSKGTYKFKTAGAVINLHKVTDAVLSEDGRTVTGSYTFPALKTQEQIAEEEAQKEAEKQAAQDAKDEKEHAADLARRWSQTEASKVENYPLGSPITLVVNEETLRESGYFEMDFDAHPYLSTGTKIYALYVGAGPKFHTLDGETINTTGMTDVDGKGGHAAYLTYQHYRINRVVYDWSRADDPSLDRFPNCTELWLSPKCDIDGILRSLANVESYKDKSDFIQENCTVFIPDSLYPNGPTYANGKAPGCKVMLYSGSDVYAAARAGKSAARDWCTNHSYTRAYISDDRLCTRPTCCTDAKFYYSCSKCGKCERNPNHTFYPTVGSFDNGEDGGKNTAHSFVNKVVTDEHFLGLNPSGERVYLYVCENCGKDRRQAASSSEKKFWATDGTGAYYNFALSKTVVGKSNGYDTYAISKDTYIAAKQHSWATGEVLAASEAGLIDKAIMGSDYTGSINRLQFCSVAVKLAEKMAGKTIAPAPSGTFTDTDNEYVRKASAAGITSGVGGGRFDPNGTLTRQQMAAFLYRALQWVKNNSDTEYTVYESKLGGYTDAGQLASWAKEPMAFMNALGLISGTGKTTLSPNGTCTIEQAVAVASRSLYADRTGWYQKNSSGSDWLVYGTRVWVYYKNGQACYRDPYGFELTGVTFSKGLRPIKDR